MRNRLPVTAACTRAALVTGMGLLFSSAAALAQSAALNSSASAAIHPWPRSAVIEEISPVELARVAAMRQQWQQQHQQSAVEGAANQAQSLAPAGATPPQSSTMLKSSAPSLAVPPAPNPLPPPRAEQSQMLLASLHQPAAARPSKADAYAYYLVASHPDAARFPYTPRDKFRLFVKDIYDPYNFMGEALQTFYNQANGDTYAFGGGAQGYGKRLGAIVATDAVGEFITTFTLSSLLRTDPRYFRQGRGGVFHRAAYAMTRVLIVRKDSGGNTFNAANWIGSLATAAVSNTYYPDRRRGFGPTAQHAAINIGFDSVYALFREFWPDVAHRLRIPAFVIRRTADPDMPEQLQKP